MIPTERTYMQIVPKVSAVISELNQVKKWLTAKRGIKRYCDENPEPYAQTLHLLDEAEKALYRSMKVFMKGEPAVVR